ncbi:MAG: hypothetical protein AAGI30_08875 [Planctomycetota bacterium]
MVNVIARRVGAAVSSMAVPRDLTAIARRNLRWELRSALLVPMAVACVEGNVLGVIANKAFEAPAWVVGLIVAAAPAANLTGFFWSTVLHGRERVRASNLFQLGVLVCVTAIAMAPLNEIGLAVLVVASCVARLMMAGLVTARGDLWRGNYSDAARARIAGRLAMAAAITVSATALLIGWAMDRSQLGGEEAYRWLFGVAVVLGGLGVFTFSRIRWRGGPTQLAGEFRSRAAGTGAGPRAMVGVLREDRFYRQYMTAQFILGFSNLAAVPVFILALKDVFDPGYLTSLVLVQAVPMLMPVLTIPLWARLLGGVHVVQFRAYHSWLFFAAIGLAATGFLLRSEGAIMVGQIIRGVAMGGGILAWNLGHHDFATRELANVYMGIHTTLTGVRGVIAPMVGAVLYSGISLPIALAAEPVGLGAWVFVLLAGIALIACLMFVRMHLATRS